MRIAVIGVGGVGGYFGALLQRAGHDLVFVARGPHLAAMRDRGLRIESAVEDPFLIGVRAETVTAGIGAVDLVLFTVKAYDTAAAAELLPPLIGDDTAVLTLQNGVDNVDLLAAAVGRDHVLGGAAYIFSSIAAPGMIRQTGGARRIVFGELDGRRTGRAELILDAFRQTGAPVELIDTIMVEMWQKYIFITAQGGMTALTRLPIGEIRASPETFDMYLDAAEEVAAVGRAVGVPIPDGQRERVRAFAQSLEPGSRSSLYHDLTQGRRMELDALPGNVVRLGREHGIPTPVCRAVYAALKPYERALGEEARKQGSD
ncbi:MAG TPA: 2-dehydropantoate 2-reductase [bacterium]|jgi:2-dehydropantoate 2-reductase